MATGVNLGEPCLAAPLGRWAALLARVPRSLRKYTVAIGGQGVLSAFNFGLNIVLVRSLLPGDYGIFALAIVVGTVGIGLNNALAAAPLSVYTPGLGRAAPRRALEATFSAVSVLMAVALGLLVFALASLLLRELPVALAFASFVTAWTWRFYSRSVAFARRSPEVALLGDLAFVAVSGAGLALAWLAGFAATSVAVPLCVLALANLAASGLELGVLGIPRRPALRRRTLQRYGRIWPQVRWSLLGVVTTSLQDQAHSLIVTGLAGPAAFAPLAAGQVIFGPIRVALQAWQMVMRPELAVAIAARNRSAVRRALLVSTGGLAALTGGIGLAVFLFWPQVHGFLYAANYADQPMALVVGLWGLITIVAAATTAPSGVLQALKQFRILAIATVIGSALSLGAVTVLLLLFQPAVSLLGVLAAAMFTLAFCLLVSLRRITQPW